MAEIPRCPKCDQPLPYCDSDDDAAQLARACSQHYGGGARECVYVPCDDLTCRALRVPATEGQYYDAYVHWRHHANAGGCSHGR